MYSLLLFSATILIHGAHSKSFNTEEAFATLQGELDDLRAEVKAFKQENAELKAIRSNNNPAFTAYPLGDRHYDEGARVTFDATSVNEGDHYSTSDNQFLCPVTGIYFFSLAVESLTTADPNFWGTVVRTVAATNTQENILSADCYDPYDHHCSNAAVGRCTAGDTVWVKAGNSGEMSGSFEDLKCSSFSGFLISID